MKHSTKLAQLEKVISAKKEEEALMVAATGTSGSIVFGQVSSISAL